MSPACRGSALIEVTVAMALLAVTASASIALQLHSTHRLALVFDDSQAMGPAIEALAMYSLGQAPNDAALENRLTHINPRFRLTLTPSTGGVRIWLDTPQRAPRGSHPRIQWPAQR